MGLSKYIFVAVKQNFKIRSRGRTIPTFTIILYLFINFSTNNENKDVPIQDYYGFRYAFHLLPVVFLNSLSLLIN